MATVRKCSFIFQFHSDNERKSGVRNMKFNVSIIFKHVYKYCTQIDKYNGVMLRTLEVISDKFRVVIICT
jgi:hypothetical protein